MKVYVYYIIVSMMLLSSCVSSTVKEDSVNISGVVVDALSGDSLGKITVELYFFEQGNIFTMGAYKLYRQVETNDQGEFDFNIEVGKSIQIKTKSVGAQLYGGLITVDEISQDKVDIVVRHKSDRN